MSVAVFRITGLALHAQHGVKEAERSLGQRFFLDLVVTAEIGNAATSDQVDETVHYGQIVKAVTSTFTNRAFNLIEAAAGAVADDLLRRFPNILAVEVTVHKPSAPVAAIVNDISATVHRRRDD